VPSQVSELRVALVSEGPTDRVLIEAALKAILTRPFTISSLQPEATRPEAGNGWCGVFKWCRQFVSRSHSALEADPTLPGFDLFVIHLDADVANCSYADCGAGMELAAQGLPELPCAQPCPEPETTVDELRARILAWLDLGDIGPRTVLCVPSKSMDAWLAASVLKPSHPLLVDLECNMRIQVRLAALPTSQRIAKSVRTYQEYSHAVTKNWPGVLEKCTQAGRFHRDVSEATGI
jgi:hypothetical protein